MSDISRPLSPESEPTARLSDPSPVDEPGGSVTAWIEQLRDGDPAAATRLWERYFRSLLALARHRLSGVAEPATDEEDVALSAFGDFCRGAGEGQFPRLQDRNGLWSLLAAITAHKASDVRARRATQKRGGNAERTDPSALADVADPDPSPDHVAVAAEECRRLLDRLDHPGHPHLRRIALLKLEGYTDDEIARQLGCVRRSVQRKLTIIRRIWSEGRVES